MSDVDVLLRAAAISTIYSGKYPTCDCMRAATHESDYAQLRCDRCLQPGDKRRPFADVSAALNRLAGLT